MCSQVALLPGETQQAHISRTAMEDALKLTSLSMDCDVDMHLENEAADRQSLGQALLEPWHCCKEAQLADADEGFVNGSEGMDLPVNIYSLAFSNDRVGN